MGSPQYSCMRQAPRKRSGLVAHFIGGTIAHPFVFCNGGWHNLDGGSCFGLRPPSTEGLAWRAPLSRPHHPPTFLGTGGHPLYPRRGLRPLHPAWRDEEGAVVPPGPPSNAFGNRGTHHTPAEATPPAPCVGTEGGTGTLHNLSPSTWAGTEGPRGAWERGMGPLRSAIQRGHSAVIAQSSAVIARS